jgi:hypothetical protein
LTVTATESEAQEPRPGAAVARPPAMQPSPDFERIGREFQMLAWDVQNLVGRLTWDPELRRRLETTLRSKDYRAVEELLRAAGVPERNEVHVEDGEVAGRIKIKICIIWNPEVNVVISW